MSGRREEAKGGTRRCRDTAFTWCAWESPRSQCGQGGFVLLALACSAARRLGESAPRWPAGSPAQWQRPRMWICVGPRDPDTKPSRGRLWVGVRKPRLVLLGFKATRNKVTATPRSYCRGCIKTRPRRAFGKRPPAPRKPKGKPGRPFFGARGGGPGDEQGTSHLAAVCETTWLRVARVRRRRPRLAAVCASAALLFFLNKNIINYK